MKNRLVTLSLLFFSFCACNTADRKAPESENDVDAARNFIQSALEGKFDRAKTYLLQDSMNQQYLDVAERSYQRLDENTIKEYRGATINVHTVNPLNDSTTIVIYSNSFKKDHDTLKVVRIKNDWLVDFKYLYLHDADTTKKTPVNDTLR